ncbi:hypothetical protein Avbf_06831 [Armadillidium vulgare]|nr:hypothetical protein Avbf_06831 [Armadillidium vulgare]
MNLRILLFFFCFIFTTMKAAGECAVHFDCYGKYENYECRKDSDCNSTGQSGKCVLIGDCDCLCFYD